jgi:NADPH-dependent 2,4-dienoyl-CoA reductase/sulfur reductase-like enzyme
MAGCARATSGTAGKPAQRVVVVGGGWGGATAAKYLRLGDPSLDVTLLEPNREFVSCPFSNLVLSGVRTIDSMTFRYDRLGRHGVKVVPAAATAIDAARQRVRAGRDEFAYDRLVVSPGIDFLWDQVEGLAAAREQVLHAWKAGEQTVRLAQQLHAMPDGGVFVMSIPPVAYRCPPGPYERASQVAWYLKEKKPKSKLIVLDANTNIVSKAGLFRTAWRAYPNLEYRPSAKVVKVDVSTREVQTEFGDRVRWDVLNVIPPQRAGTIAVDSGLAGADKRWCEVDHVTYESKQVPRIHVVGDATTGVPMPKSGNAANAMAKVCASAIVHLLAGKQPPVMAPANTCYSWVSDREAIVVVNAYRIDNGKIVQVEQTLSPAQSVDVARNAVGWAQSIWNDVLG